MTACLNWILTWTVDLILAGAQLPACLHFEDEVDDCIRRPLYQGMIQMRTEDERIQRLHMRARELKKKKERLELTLSGGASVLLTVLLVAVMLRTDRVYQNLVGSGFTGSSLLSESAGGYVLAAVIAFFIGVVITAVIYRYRKRK